MDYKKRRSSLRKSIADLCPVDAKTFPKRRISFSGKNSVRVFYGEEEPKIWNNSYEISDHLNPNETVPNLAGSETKLENILKDTNEQTETNQTVVHTILHTQPIYSERNCTNVLINNSLSALNSTKDLINISYQNSKMYQIENSVDITLCDREKKFQTGEVKNLDRATTTTSYSFSLEDYENADGTNVLAEKTIDFMRDPTTNTDNGINEDSDKHKPTTSTMQVAVASFEKYDKENVNPLSTQNVREAQKNNSQLKPENEIFSSSQYRTGNVQSDLEGKLNELHLCDETNSNEIYKSSKCEDVKSTARNSTQLLNKNSKDQLKHKFNNKNNISPSKLTEDIAVTLQAATNFESNGRNAIPQIELYSKEKFSQTAEKVPTKINNTAMTEYLKVVESKSKHVVQPKLTVRKICTPQLNKTANIPSLEKTRQLKCKRKQEQNVVTDNASNKSPCAIETMNLAEKSLNFSLDSAENMSLASESSSPLIPLQFKGYTLRQLNDEIESGKIKIFSNNYKTTTTDQKAQSQMSSSKFRSKNIKSPQSRTNVTESPTSDILSKLSKFNIKKTVSDCDFVQHPETIERTSNSRCRYSEADDIMLDNTSFLTKAKLSDDTVSRNSSKRDITDVSINKPKNKLENEFFASTLKSKTSCIKENEGRNGMFQNAESISAEKLRDIEDINLYDKMDISIAIEDDIDITKAEQFMKKGRDTVYFHNDLISENEFNETKGLENVTNLQTSIINLDDSIKNALTFRNASMKPQDRDIDIYSTISARKTLFFNEEIPPEEELITTEKKTFIAKSILGPTRNTLIFNHEISIEEKSMLNAENDSVPNEKITKENEWLSNKCHKKCLLNETSEMICENLEASLDNNFFPMDEVVTAEKTYSDEKALPVNGNVQDAFFDTDNCSLYQTNPSHFNHENVLQNTQMNIFKIIESEPEMAMPIGYKHKTRETIYFNNEISLENDSFDIEKDKENPAAINNISGSQNSNETNKTKYFNNEIGKWDETTNFINNQLPQSRKSIKLSEDMNLTLNEDAIEIKRKTDCVFPNKEDFFDGSFEPMDSNKSHVEELSGNKTKVAAEKETISKSERIDLETSGDNVAEYKNGNYNTGYAQDDKLSVSESSNKDKRKTLYYEDGNEMSLEQSLTLFEEIQENKHTRTSSSSRVTLAGQKDANSLASIVKSNNKNESLLFTPIKYTGSNKKHPLVSITPRLSLLEFTKLEKKAREEERVKNSRRTESFSKRLADNLTPVTSIPKKRQTLLSIVESSSEKMNTAKKSDNTIQADEKREEKEAVRSTAYSDGIEMSNNLLNESALLIGSRERKSRIPIASVNASKTNKSFSLHECDTIHMETSVDNVEGDNLAESIQLLRKGTTFTQGNDNFDLGAEIKPIGKTSIFEGNPITISDVSVFFETQKNVEMSLPSRSIGASVPKTTESPQKGLENRFINLTLEDIDKTRLSLVQISYEGGNTDGPMLCGGQEKIPIETELPSNDAVVSATVENANLKNQLRRVNYLRNNSLVCRKCKRCQETLIDESALSLSETYSLPEVPTTPDIGLDHLQRLRQLPSIASVNVLWQRVSLEYTRNNPSNNYHNDSPIIGNLHEKEDSAAAKFIREYDCNIASFEMDLEKSQGNSSAENVPFVLRLNALLRTNTTNNWIYDYQMQSRGILMFTHKKMMTFAVLLTYEEVDALGCDINLKSIKLESGHVPKKNWKPIDYVLDFQLKLNLPFNLRWLCQDNNEYSILKMLQQIDEVCLETVKMGNCLQRISFSNQAYIKRDGCRTILEKTIRKIVNNPNSDLKYVEKTQINIELLNLKSLCFKDIIYPRLHHFHEEIHLLPTGLEFLETFLPNPLHYLKDH